MKTQRPFSLQGLVLIIGTILLSAGFRTGNADEKPATAKKVAAGWRHPDAQANSGRSGSGDGVVNGDTFRVPRPFEEVWTFYAKKCGYMSPYPTAGTTMAVSGSGACAMMYENSTGSGGGVSSVFMYHENGTVIGVSLVDRKDGVRVYVAVAAK
jgi:hypothetical protein